MNLPVDIPEVPEFALVADPVSIRAALMTPRAHVAEAIGAERLRECREISMLHPDSLAMLAFFASRAKGPVLEIGPFVGGSTAAICAGLQRRDAGDASPEGASPGGQSPGGQSKTDATRGRFPGHLPGGLVTIEIGGSKTDHERMNTPDIVADLRRNLARLGCAERVAVVNRVAADPRAVRDVDGHLSRFAAESGSNDPRVGMFVIDADGLVEDHLGRYARFLRDDCLIVLDDYAAPGAREKEALLRSFVEAQCQAGRLRELAMVAWGTWFGQLCGPEARAWLAARRAPFHADGGHCYYATLLVSSPPDSAETPTRAAATLYEDGRALGPAHTVHDEIRSLGRGRFSLWMRDSAAENGLYSAQLYFAASDNSDPRSNGRTYELEIDGRRIDVRTA